MLQKSTVKEKMSTLKFKEKSSYDDGPSNKNVLLCLVRLVHADPKLMLNVSFFILLVHMANITFPYFVHPTG